MDRLSGWCKSERKLKDHTIIVTGSNSGIGKETALDLYSRGARVIMACRDVNKAEMVKQEIEKEVENTGGALVVEKLDLSRLTSVREFAERLLAREARVQLLINNAGVFMPPQRKTEDGFEMHMGTNHFGHALLTLLLLPRIIESAPSRIIFVSSTSYRLKKLNLDKPEKHRNPRNSFMDYARSKTANVLFAKALAVKLKEYGLQDVTTYSLHPGTVSTNIARNQINRSSGLFKSWLTNKALLLFLKSPKCGAQTTIYCAVEETCANESGLYYSLTISNKTPSDTSPGPVVLPEKRSILILGPSGTLEGTSLEFVPAQAEPDTHVQATLDQTIPVQAPLEPATTVQATLQKPTTTELTTLKPATPVQAKLEQATFVQTIFLQKKQIDLYI